mmetsp:Transcript_162138/g.296040  ORF Transcript_162138/g.296040 Transcript_162138/m.296040 type:complete len:690 (-) Transcript_162138:85-2154(-)
MKMAAKCMLALVLLTQSQIVQARSDATVTPIGKVVEMLKDMLAKGTKEKQDEEVKYAAFSTWCTNTQKMKSGEIAESEQAIELYKAKIQQAEVRMVELTDRINELTEDVGRWEQDAAAAANVRQKEVTDYTSTAQDYSESLDALDGAIAVLKKQSYDRPQADLIQTVAKVHGLRLLPQPAKKALWAFMQQAQPEELSYEAPEANAYEFQSGGVIDILQKLKLEFSKKKMELDKEELQTQHAYEMLKQSLADNTEGAKAEISKKTLARGATEEKKAATTGDLQTTQGELAEDKSYLESTKSLCTVKASDFESRNKLRADELKALKEAIEIIESNTVAGSGEKYLPSLLQYQREREGTLRVKKVLAQLRGDQQSPLQARIATFLADRARSIDSQLLSLVSQKVSTDPFTKVKKMIKDLIQKLMAEGTTETEHKGWCDTQLATNKLTREDKAEEVEKLSAEVEGLNAEIVKLTQDIEETSAAIAEISDAMAKATAERTAAKEENQETMAEAKEAITALEQAIALIKDYYAKSAEATSLAQQTGSQTPAEDAPETWSKPFKGQLPEGGSVVDFLQVILSDFARLEADASSAESTQADVYKKYMFESEKDKALKVNAMEHMQNTVTDKKSMLHATEAELKASKGQLEKAIQYYEKLKPNCVDSGITYEERVRRREEEIQSLQEAIQILEGSDIA